MVKYAILLTFLTLCLIETPAAPYAHLALKGLAPTAVNAQGGTPGLIFNESGGTTIVTEDFALLSSDSYTVRLSTQPTGDVTIVLTFDSTFVAIPDGTPQGIQINGLGTGLTLTFTSTNWATPQVLTVRAYEDFVDEIPDPKPFIVTHTIQSASDASYNALPPQTRTVNVRDGITSSPNTFGLIAPANNTLYPAGDLSALTSVQWEDPVNAVTFNVTFNGITGTPGVSLTLNNLTRSPDADPLTCNGVICTFIIGTQKDALLTGNYEGEIRWSVTATAPLASTNATTPFSFYIGRVPTVATELEAPPPSPTCDSENANADAVVRTGIPDALAYAINCRVLYFNGAPTTWLGGSLYSEANLGAAGLLELGVMQAVDIFSPPPVSMGYFEGGFVMCLSGAGTLIWLEGSQAPRVPQIIGSYTVPEFPGFTCATLFEPGTLVLVSENPLEE